MPSVSEKQKKFMQAAAHNKGFAKKAGISQAVAREFNDADKALAGKRSVKAKIRTRYGKN